MKIMKKPVLFLLLFSLGFFFQVTAQEHAIVQGYCKDENGKAIENVSVYVHDSLLVSVTNEQYTARNANFGALQTTQQERFR